MHKAILIMGPPGSGKGTQADLVAYKFNLIHLDTGRYLESLFQEGRMPSKIRKEFKEGKVLDPAWVSKIFREQIKRIASVGFGIVLSGSPRTIFEAFGDRKTKGIMQILSDAYAKKNIIVFHLDIPAEVTLARNTKRRVCSICWKSHLLGSTLRKCPFCGGKLIRRVQDKPEIIKNRLREYKERTEPVLKGLKSRRFKVIKINGLPPPFQVFQAIQKYL